MAVMKYDGLLRALQGNREFGRLKTDAGQGGKQQQFITARTSIIL
jgi:hypothetical protein